MVDPSSCIHFFCLLMLQPAAVVSFTNCSCLLLSTVSSSSTFFCFLFYCCCVTFLILKCLKFWLGFCCCCCRRGVANCLFALHFRLLRVREAALPNFTQQPPKNLASIKTGFYSRDIAQKAIMIEMMVFRSLSPCPLSSFLSTCCVWFGLLLLFLFIIIVKYVHWPLPNYQFRGIVCIFVGWPCKSLLFVGFVGPKLCIFKLNTHFGIFSFVAWSEKATFNLIFN